MVCNNGIASGRKYNKWFRNDFLSKYHSIVIKYYNTKVLYIQYNSKYNVFMNIKKIVSASYYKQYFSDFNTFGCC